MTWRALVHTQRDSSLADAVAAAGGVLDEVDLIDRHPLPAEEVRARLDGIADIEWVVVTSPYTVQALQELGLESVLASGRNLAAVGPSTAKVLAELNFVVDLVPSGGSSGAALAAVFPAPQDHPHTVLIPGAKQTAGTLEPGLKAKGWQVYSVPVYETHETTTIDEQIAESWNSGEYSVFVATSPSTVRAAAALLGTTVPTLAIGPSSYKAAIAAGFPRVLESESPTAADMVAAMTRILQER
ncbi:MAG: uroporphyrinogen-III synthase [Propionibacteriaceae bacterium]|jgi:uroporphyrinogen-III synthase|nr:uroporphyrinogen-III synthase [Propionibacteriaceae bacterium]